MSVITSIVNAIMYMCKWLANRNDPGAVKQRQADAREKDVQSIAGEVRSKDTDAVNRRISDIRRAGLPLVVVLGLLAAAGCQATRVVYVPEGDTVVPMERDGRPGWWVPDHVLADLIERATVNANKAKEPKQ